MTIQVQPSAKGGCGGYDDVIAGQFTRVPGGTGVVERSFQVFTTFTTGCGQTQIRVENGEVYVELIRLLLLDPFNDPSGSPFYDQFLYADYRFGPR
jgi:hypothetical protein